MYTQTSTVLLTKLKAHKAKTGTTLTLVQVAEVKVIIHCTIAIVAYGA
jgi:hypothetical protein